jgi:hypothetical protein
MGATGKDLYYLTETLSTCVWVCHHWRCAVRAVRAVCGEEYPEIVE